MGNRDVLRADVSSLKLPGMWNTAPNRGLSPEFSLLPTAASAPETQEPFTLITEASCDMTKRSKGRYVWENPFITLFRIFIAFV